MSLQQSSRDNPLLDTEDRFLHLKAIDVDFVRARPNTKLEIKFSHESEFKHKSTVFRRTDRLHWECDIYIKSRTNAILSVRKSSIVRLGSQVVAEFHLDCKSVEFADGTPVERKDQASGVKIMLLFGKSKPNLEVTRLLADKATIALATKISMLDKLDQVFGYLDLVLKSGSGAAQLHPAAQSVIPIVTEAVRKFQEIPACHHEFVFVMDDIVSMLPVMRLALDRVTDIEVQRLLRTFIDLTKRVSQDSIEYSSRSASDFLLRNWFQSKKGDVDKLKNQMLHLKLNVGIGLGVDFKGGVLEIQGSVAENQKAINEIRQHQLSEADKKNLERLKPAEKSSYDLSRCCLPGTRTLLLQEVEQWYSSTDHPSRLYWIYGVAGCGKSSIAASVASALDSQKLPFGSFFCKRDIPERRDPVRLIRALAYLLARTSAPFSEVLLRALEKEPDIFDRPLSTQFRALLADRLTEVSQSAPTSPIIIILDALDECDDNKAVSSFLMQMVALAPWLRLIVTSRPLPEIQKELQSSEELVFSCDLFKLPTDGDIVTYTRNQFGEKGNLAALRTHVTDAQIEALGQKAEGLFIWIVTVLSYISLRKIGKFEVLKQILHSAVPSETEKKLDALYLQVLNSAVASEDIAANKDAIQAIRLIVGLVFMTSRNRPLPANALYAFIPLELGVLQQELEAVLQDLGSVFTTDSQTNAVRVCHPSFLDFIGNQTRSGDFWTETAKLDAMMVESCFRIMMSGLKFNICKLKSSYLRNSDVDDLKERVALYIPQELQYSCVYWMNHLSGSGTNYLSEEPVRQMLCNLLCQTRSLYWLEALSLMSELKTAGAILQGLLDAYKLKDDAKLWSNIMDLYRFVKAFHEPMARSTPHIYVSALLWTPSESIIAKSHCLDFNSRDCVLEGRNKYWPSNLQTLLLGSAVNSVAYSPDGRHIVSGSDDKIVRIWDAHTGTPVGEPLHGHGEKITSVGYSPDGHHIVSGSFDKTVRIWDAQTGTPVGEPLRGHDGTVDGVAYSPDGRHIVSGSFDRTIRIWDAHTGAPVGEPLQGHGNTVKCVAYSPDGRHIVSGSGSTTVRIWDAQTGAPVGKPLRGHDGWVMSVTYSPDGCHIASGSFDKTIRIWDAQTGSPVGEPLQGHDDRVWSVGYSPDGCRIVSGSRDKTVRIWDAETGSPIGESLQGHDDAVWSVGYSPDGRYIVSGSFDRTIRIWDAQTGSPVGESLQGHDDTVWSVTCSPDGCYIACGSSDKTIRIWDARTGAPVGKPLHGHNHLVRSVGYSPDGRHIVSVSNDRTVRIWDAQTGVPVGRPLHGHDGAVTSVGYSPDGRHIVSGSRDKTVRIWDAQTGTPVGEPLQGHGSTVNGVAYSPDGRHIVSGSDDKIVRIWDAHTGALIGGPLQGHDDGVGSVGYSPDGRHIASGSFDKTVRVWDAQTGAPVGEPLQGHDDGVWSVTYSPDGRHIVSGSFDRTIRIWDAQTGSPVSEPLRGHDDWVTSVTYSPDGRHIVSGSFDKTVRIWDTRTGSSASDLSQRLSQQSAYSLDGKYFVSCSINSTVVEASKIGPAVCSEIPRSIAMDGWIRTLDGGLLLWVPPEYRNGVCDMSLLCLPHNAAGRRVRINWRMLHHGSAWCAVKDDRAED